MLKEVIQLSYIIVVADVTLLLFLLFNSTLSPKRRACFISAAIIALILIICNIIRFLFQGTGTNIGLMRLSSAISYSISGPVVLPFIFISSVIGKRIRVTVLLLAGLNTILSFISIYNGCIFKYDELGYLTLGWLWPVPFILSGMYVSVLFISSIIKFKLGSHHESLFIMILSIFIISAVIMNTFYGFRFLVSGMVILSATFYYMFFTTQTLTRDAMTDALNRHSFYKDILTLKKKQMFIVAMDLNGLKRINDTQGHDAGDKAILAVSECAMMMLPVKCRFYRMGGDEFEILYPSATYSEVELMLNKIRDAISRKGYSVAIGFGEYKRGMNFEEVFREVDAMMYEDKARMKAAEMQK